MNLDLLESFSLLGYRRETEERMSCPKDSRALYCAYLISTALLILMALRLARMRIIE